MSEHLLRTIAMLEVVPRHPKYIDTPDLEKALAARGYKATPRTLQRDLKELARYLPLECVDPSTKPFKWRWQQHAATFELPVMDPATALTFKLGASFLARVLPPDAYERIERKQQQADKVLANLPHSKLAGWPQKVRVTSAGLPVGTPEIAPGVLDVVAQALLQDYGFDCEYRKRGGEVRSYKVNPLALVYRDAIAVLVCTVNGHDNPITLMLHRMLEAKSSARPRRVPKGFDLDRFLSAGGSGFLLSPEPVELVLLVHATAIATVSELPISKAMKIERHDDTRFRVEGTAPNSLELRRWIMGFGDAVEVLAPEDLRAKMAHVAENLAARYARRSGEVAKGGAIAKGDDDGWGAPVVYEEKGYLWTESG